MAKCNTQFLLPNKTLWPSGLRRWLKAPVRKGVGSNPTGVTCFTNAMRTATTSGDARSAQRRPKTNPKPGTQRPAHVQPQAQTKCPNPRQKQISNSKTKMRSKKQLEGCGVSEKGRPETTDEVVHSQSLRPPHFVLFSDIPAPI